MLGLRGRFPQRHKLNIPAPLSAAFNPAYDRYPKQGSDTEHVLSKDETQKKLSSYHLFMKQAKRQGGHFSGPALLLPGEDAEGMPAPWDSAAGRRWAARSTPLSARLLWQPPWSPWILEKSDHCGNLSRKFNILLSVTMPSFWETQSWRLKIKQQCGNSETNSSAPVHPSRHAWSPQSPVTLSPDQLRSSQETTCKCIPAEQYHPQHLSAVDAQLQ